MRTRKHNTTRIVKLPKVPSFFEVLCSEFASMTRIVQPHTQVLVGSNPFHIADVCVSRPLIPLQLCFSRYKQTNPQSQRFWLAATRSFPSGLPSHQIRYVTCPCALQRSSRSDQGPEMTHTLEMRTRKAPIGAHPERRRPQLGVRAHPTKPTRECVSWEVDFAQKS